MIEGKPEEGFDVPLEESGVGLLGDDSPNRDDGEGAFCVHNCNNV